MDRNVTISLEEQLFGFPIRCTATRLDEGLHVLITGGIKTHIGAVSTCRPVEEPETKYFPGHKDQFVSAPWAKALAEKLSEPACVVCGIHYDNITKEQIAEIMAVTDKLLNELLNQI